MNYYKYQKLKMKSINSSLQSANCGVSMLFQPNLLQSSCLFQLTWRAWPASWSGSCCGRWRGCCFSPVPGVFSPSFEQQLLRWFSSCGGSISEAWLSSQQAENSSQLVGSLMERDALKSNYKIPLESFCRFCKCLQKALGQRRRTKVLLYHPGSERTAFSSVLMTEALTEAESQN